MRWFASSIPLLNLWRLNHETPYSRPQYRHQGVSSNLDGLFLVRVERASYRWRPAEALPGIAVPHSRTHCLLVGIFGSPATVLHGTYPLETCMVSP